MQGSNNLLQALHTALVIIARDSGEVLEHQGELPLPADGLIGRDWRDALGVPADGTAVIGQALASGEAAALPPTIMAAAAEQSLVMGGMVVPCQHAGQEAMALFLRRLAVDEELLDERRVGVADVVAVLGVDRLEFSPSWGAAETERLMMDLRSLLSRLSRPGDYIGLPAGATLTLLLRDTDPTQALDISRALLSQLHQRLARHGGGAQYARACVGLAQRLEEQSPLATLVAANGALRQAQSGGEDRIRFASPWDPLAQAARAVTGSGLFRDSAADAGGRHFLQRLLSLGLENKSGAACVNAVLELALAYPGVRRAALVNVTAEGPLQCVAHRTSGSRDGLPQRLQKALAGLSQADLVATCELVAGPEGCRLFPLAAGDLPWGGLLLQYRSGGGPAFQPGAAALAYLSEVLVGAGFGGAAVGEGSTAARAMERGIEGYVTDNMEGAIDQALFLAQVDIPVAIIGGPGTGKMYIAQVIHAEGGRAAADLVQIDCSELRNRSEGQARITGELQGAAGRTLVFKSPQLLHPELQGKLARMLATRTVSDGEGARYLPASRYLALFPTSLETLVRRGELDPRLASVFAGYPIQVPPLRDRKRAVLRWAHKILEQEAAQADRRVQGFTADAEQAMLQHPWRGNISEMRGVIRTALGRTENEWITPVDLGIYLGIEADGRGAGAAGDRPFLESVQSPEPQAAYQPTDLEALAQALGQALAATLETGVLRPLGAWLDDEIVLAASERCGGDSRATAAFLHTRSRNIGRWMPKIEERRPDRDASLMWQESRRLVRSWVQGAEPGEDAPQELAQERLLQLVLQQCGGLSVADRARLMGVSTPTFQKRVKQLEQEA